MPTMPPRDSDARGARKKLSVEFALARKLERSAGGSPALDALRRRTTQLVLSFTCRRRWRALATSLCAALLSPAPAPIESEIRSSWAAFRVVAGKQTMAHCVYRALRSIQFRQSVASIRQLPPTAPAGEQVMLPSAQPRAGRDVAGRLFVLD